MNAIIMTLYFEALLLAVFILVTAVAAAHERFGPAARAKNRPSFTPAWRRVHALRHGA